MIKLKKILAEQSNIDMAAAAAQNVQLRKQRDDLYNKMSDEQRLKFRRMKEKYYNPEVFERELSSLGWRMDYKSALDDDGVVIFNHRNKREMIPIRWYTQIYDDTENYDLNPDMPGPKAFHTLGDDYVKFNNKHYDLVKGNEEMLATKLTRLSIKASGTKEIPYQGPPKL